MNYEEAKQSGAKFFDPEKPCNQGHTAKRRTSNKKCTECTKILRRKAYQKLKPENKRELWAIKKLNDASGILYHSAKLRAKRKNWEFTLNKSDIVIPCFCPCCSRTLTINKPIKEKHVTNPLAPSLDRVRSDLGYTPENTRVICWGCNRLKSNFTMVELENILNYMKSC